MQVLAAEGISTTVEVGTGAVLCGLIKRSLKGVTPAQINGIDSLGQA